jgi:hypothetical protein
MSVEITKKFVDDKSNNSLEVFLNVKNEISFFINEEYGVSLDIETAEELFFVLKKIISDEKKGGSDE